MNKQREIAVVGQIYVDHILTGFSGWPRPGEELFTKEYVQEVGGGGAITACALSRLGRSTTLIGAVGTDEMPWLTRRLADFSVLTSGLLAGPGRTGVTICLSNQTDRSFFTYAGENDRLEDQLASESLLECLCRHAHVHFAMPLSAPLAAHLLPRLHAAGCIVSLDVGHQVDWLRDAVNLATCAVVDYLLPNELEANLLSAGDSTVYLNFTRQNQWPHGVVKLGPRGAAMRIDNHNFHVDAPPMHVVDTTGAGDAFNAGFIDGLLDHASGVECLRRGCISGGMSTRFAGALNGLCNRRQLQECYEQSYG
jgi:sugar/nucleoside kinase (ribokinase family)